MIGVLLVGKGTGLSAATDDLALVEDVHVGPEGKELD
jgi:hypothetical protein